MNVSREKLLLAMAYACMTDDELCRKSGVARPTLVTIKAEKVSHKPATVGKLARALGVPVEQLLKDWPPQA